MAQGSVAEASREGPGPEAWTVSQRGFRGAHQMNPSSSGPGTQKEGGREGGMKGGREGGA